MYKGEHKQVKANATTLKVSEQTVQCKNFCKLILEYQLRKMRVFCVNGCVYTSACVCINLCVCVRGFNAAFTCG